jgi:hypothetical protein
MQVAANREATMNNSPTLLRNREINQLSDKEHHSNYPDGCSLLEKGG